MSTKQSFIYTKCSFWRVHLKKFSVIWSGKDLWFSFILHKYNALCQVHLPYFENRNSYFHFKTLLSENTNFYFQNMADELGINKQSIRESLTSMLNLENDKSNAKYCIRVVSSIHNCQRKAIRIATLTCFWTIWI